MQVHNNQITVTRGESWTLSKKIENQDGSPFIISSRIKEPYFLVTVASSLYNTPDRYVFNKWLELKDIPRFECTNAIRLADYGLKFSDNTLPFLDNDGNGENDFTGDETSGYSNIAIFYEKTPEGVINYKYWEYIDNIEGNYSGRWVPYECLLVTHFGSDVTRNWISQNYYYQILLVEAHREGESDKPSDVEILQNILSPNKIIVKPNLKGGLFNG